MNKTLALIVSLQVLTLAGQWVSPPSLSPAVAQSADPGMQRTAMVEEQKATNAKLDKLISILESGELQVKVVSPDEKK